VGNECRLVTAVNVIGKIDGESTALQSVQDGDSITISALTP
jgi:hypothetical protein